MKISGDKTMSGKYAGKLDFYMQYGVRNTELLRKGGKNYSV